METYYASPMRISGDELEEQIRIVSRNPVVSGLMHSVGGLLAILNEHRQIIAINDAFLRTLGIDSSDEAFGLRPGEAIHCIHANDEPAGCGTTQYCSTCGAAIAIVTSLAEKIDVERLCAVTAERNGQTVDIALLVKAQPIVVEDRQLLLLLVHDVTIEQRRAAIERTFFHDVNNLLSGLLQASELMVEQSSERLPELILDTVKRMHGEVAIQRYLSSVDQGRYHPSWRSCSSNKIMEDINIFLNQHPASRNKHIESTQLVDDINITTDAAAIFRVLCNMVINGLEATDEGGTVKFWIESGDSEVTFCVWNRKEIPEDIARRLFQRNFSTKDEPGRGIGTFSMKLLGEDILTGKIDFSSNQGDGTTFRFTHPIGDAN